MQKKLTIRLDLETVADLAAVADATHLTITGVMRGAIQYAILHPEVLTETTLPVVDVRSPEQAANFEAAFGELTSPARLHELLEKCTPPMRQSGRGEQKAHLFT
jgi:hypothetical protein